MIPDVQVNVRLPMVADFGDLPVCNPSALPADKNPPLVFLARLAPGSRRSMSQALRYVVGLIVGEQGDPLCFPWEQLTFARAAALRSRIGEEPLATATKNRVLAAVRGTLKAAWQLGRMSSEDYSRSIAAFPSLKGNSLPKGRYVETPELAKLFGACDDGISGFRDRALLAVLFGAGLRRSEVIALDLADYSPSTGELRIHNSKGGKSRVVFLGSSARAALGDWLQKRGLEDGPLFLAVNKGGVIRQGQRLSSQAVWLFLDKRVRQAGILGCSPHDGRRSYISALLDSGTDLATAQALAGHSSPVTTSRYDRRGERSKKAAAVRIALPIDG